jgi:hypothetical protein
MIGVDTTFLVQLELVELPAHKAADAFLQRQILQQQVPLALVVPTSPCRAGSGEAVAGFTEADCPCRVWPR